MATKTVKKLPRSVIKAALNKTKNKDVTALRDERLKTPLVYKKPDATEAKNPEPVENASKFVLEDGMDIPPRKHGGKGGPASPYPFASMAVGQNFFVSAEIERGVYLSEAEADKAQLEECRKVANRMTGAVRRFSNLNKGFKFTVRTVSAPHGVRVWRTDGTK